MVELLIFHTIIDLNQSTESYPPHQWDEPNPGVSQSESQTQNDTDKEDRETKETSLVLVCCVFSETSVYLRQVGIHNTV